MSVQERSEWFSELTWRVDAGSIGEDRSTENPLHRAVLPLLVHGKPFNRISNCFFQTIFGPLRWLGVLVHGAGDRVIFFPGYSSLQTHVTGFHGRRKKWDQDFQIDHLTLEKNRKSWHFTNAGSLGHLGKLPTFDLGDSRTLWFSMSVSGEVFLRQLRRDTLVTLPSSKNDFERRVEIFRKAREGAQFPLISLTTEHSRMPGPAFLRFAFIVGPPKFPEYLGPWDGDNDNSPFHYPVWRKTDEYFPIRTHRVELSDTLELQIACYEVPGVISMPFVYSVPLRK